MGKGNNHAGRGRRSHPPAPSRPIAIPRFNGSGNFNHGKDRRGLMGVVCWGVFLQNFVLGFGIVVVCGFVVCSDFCCVVCVFTMGVDWIWWRC